MQISKLSEKQYETVITFGKEIHNDYLKDNNVSSLVLNWPLDKTEPNAASFIKNKKIDMVINIPKSFARKELTNGYLIRRAAVDYNVPLITNTQVAKLFIRSISEYREKDLHVKPWSQYTTH